MVQPKHVFEIYIRTTPEELWAAITSPALTRKYLYRSAVESEFVPGSRYVYRTPEGRVVLEGEILAVAPRERLVMSFSAAHDPQMHREPPSRITWQISALAESLCKPTFVHDNFESETKTFRRAASDWNVVLSGLKTLLETGEPPEFPRSSK